MNEQELTSITDEDLLHQIDAGSQVAFGALYDRYSVMLYNYVRRLIFDDETAQDILQDTFMVVWQRAGTFHGKSRVSTWLFSIAHHRAVDWLRNQHRVGRKLFSLDILDVFHESERTVEDWISHNLQNEHIWQALAQLTPDHRAVLELAFVYEMPQQEIAQVLGCPIGTVKSRMHHALKALNGYLIRNTSDK